MTTIYFEDGSREYIINPQYDFRRVIEDRLGKDSADFFDQLIEDITIEAQGHTDSILCEIGKEVGIAINRVEKGDESFSILDFLYDIRKKLNE